MDSEYMEIIEDIISELKEGDPTRSENYYYRYNDIEISCDVSEGKLNGECRIEHIGHYFYRTIKCHFHDNLLQGPFKETSGKETKICNYSNGILSGEYQVTVD